MTDPYLVPGTKCLGNKLGFTDPAELRDVEARLVSIRDVELARETLPGEYNLTHLQAFHRALFRDVYSWAGEIRTVNISKDRSMFAVWQFVEDATSSLLARLQDDRWLIGASRDHFVERLAFYYGELNVCHPFREGNGRTQRAFLRQLSAAAGWRLDWSALNRADNVAASELVLLKADFSLMQQVLGPVVVRM